MRTHLLVATVTAVTLTGVGALGAAAQPAAAVASTPGSTFSVASGSVRAAPGATGVVATPRASVADHQLQLETSDAATAAAAGGLGYCAAAADKNPVPDGQPMVVQFTPGPKFTVGKIAASAWFDARTPSKDPTWQMKFRGLMWITPLAVRASQDGQQKSLATLVNQAILFHKQDPDVGKVVNGWDEATAMRRTQTLNCLYALTGDKRLVPHIKTNVAVQFSKRYYGPPRFHVHNHGMLANLAVLKSAALLGRTDWRDRVAARMRKEWPLVFTPTGMAFEQSSGYQKVNADLWTTGAAQLAAINPKDPALPPLRAITAKARRMFSWLTEPDGKIVQYGDAELIAGRPDPSLGRFVRDDKAGIIVGRWSATDPSTTYYTLRYGPPRAFHGHEDRSSITYTTRGARVLVGVGTYTYNAKEKYRIWSSTNPASANTTIVTKARFKTGAPVKVTASKIQGPAHAWTVVDTLWGVRHTRNVQVNGHASTMTVKDTYPRATKFRQTWHLDARWTLAGKSRDGKRVTFTSNGKTLTVRTTGVVASVLRGETRGPNGWVFPAMYKRYPANQVWIAATGTTTTTFTVR